MLCKSPPRIMALDLGTTTGWAVRDQYGMISSGTASFKHSRFQGGGMRYLLFLRWLKETTVLTGSFNQIYFEEVRRHTATDAAHVYGGLLAHLTAWCEENFIPYQGVPVGTIKRHATGKGNAKKEAVIKAMQAKGYQPKDDNEADALAILLWAIEQQRSAI